MELDQLRPGLWRWTTPHPDWRPDEEWDRDVGSVAVVSDDAFVLVDPLAPSDEADRERFWRAVDDDVAHHGPPHVVLTVPWHRRSTDEVLDRYDDARLWVHRPGAGDARRHTDIFDAGDALPAGLTPIDGRWEGEALLWIPAHRALVSGDVLLGGADGGLRMCPDSWLPEDLTPAALRDALQPLLDLPVELVLPAHGEPVLQDGRAALERALAP